jgi:predicted metal-binding protein
VQCIRVDRVTLLQRWQWAVAVVAVAGGCAAAALPRCVGSGSGLRGSTLHTKTCTLNSVPMPRYRSADAIDAISRTKELPEALDQKHLTGNFCTGSAEAELVRKIRGRHVHLDVCMVPRCGLDKVVPRARNGRCEQISRGGGGGGCSGSGSGGGSGGVHIWIGGVCRYT